MSSTVVPTPSPPVINKDARINALIHMYRAEQIKMTTYRLRMDSTTNWAVSMTGILTVFSLGNEVPLYFFFFIAFMNVVFCTIESRHMAVFLAHRKRTFDGVFFYKKNNSPTSTNYIISRRFLEDGFYTIEVLQQSEQDSAINWDKELISSLRDNGSDFASPRWPMIYIRFVRIYIYLLSAVYLGWIFKLIDSNYSARTKAIIWGSTTFILCIVMTVVYCLRPRINLHVMTLNGIPL